MNAGFAAERLPGQTLQITICDRSPGRLLANPQIMQLFTGKEKLGDIVHTDTILVQDAAECIVSRYRILMTAGISVGLLIEFILRDGFFFLRGLVD